MLERIDRELHEKLALLRGWQNADGGIPAYVAGDASGAWTTAEVLFVLLEHLGPEFGVAADDTFVANLARFIAVHQNPDGGWPYRDVGESFVDPSAWCALALVRLPATSAEALTRALDFLLDARRRSGEWTGAWGIQRDEFVRTYSTGIAIEALHRLAQDERVRSLSGRLSEVDGALRCGQDFLRRTNNADGGWGTRPGAASDAGCTACALHALFVNAVRSERPGDSLRWLWAQQQPNGVWESFEEVLPLRSGLEVTQQWFVHPECIDALCFFTDAAQLEIGRLAEATEALWHFVDGEGRLRYAPETASKDYTWLVPFYLRGLARVRRCLGSRRAEYDAYVAKRRAEEREERRRVIVERVAKDYPFPVAEPFSRIEREDNPMRRFRGLLDCVEPFVILTASLAVASLAEHPECVPSGDVLQRGKLHNTGVGSWLRMAERISALPALLARNAVVNRIARTLDANVCDETGQVITARQALQRLVDARNTDWGHLALATDLEYVEYGQRMRALLEAVLDAFAWFAEYNLFYVTRSVEDGWGEESIYTVVNCRGLRFGDRKPMKSTRRLHTGDDVKPLYWGGAGSESVLNLSPLWHFGPCRECRGRERFFCHQNLDEQGGTYLSYECAHRLTLPNRALYEKLLKRLTQPS